MTDVYEQAGIPVPKDPDAIVAGIPVEEAELKSDLCCEKCKDEPENKMAGIDEDWRKIEREREERQLRLECARIVFTEMQGTGTALMNTTQQLFEFVNNGPKPVDGTDDDLGFDKF